MTVYTVSSCDNHPKLGDSRCTIGSFTTRGRALDKCVDYIMERLRVRNDFAFCMANDDNHPEAKEFFSGRVGRSDSWRVKRGKAKALRAFLRDVLGGNGYYHAYLDAGMGRLSLCFDVDENDLEGELWYTVTWVDGSHRGLIFTNPWPEAFASRETAVETFIGFMKGFGESCRMTWHDEFLRETRRALKADGKVRVNLNGGMSVNCILYHDDAKNIKE